MRIYFLSENKTDNPGIRAEHGLSIYIEAEEMNILFDTGASDLFLDNAEKMNVDLNLADVCVISHGHYDHTEGVPSFCRLNENADVIIHKDAFIKTYDMRSNGSLSEETTGIRWSDEVFDEIKDRLRLTENELWLTDSIVVSGTVHEIEGFKATESFYSVIDGEIVPDKMNHEQFLVIKQDDGIFVFSGCSHRGVIPILRHAKELFPGLPVKGLVAGMHLYSASAEVRKTVVDEVCGEDMEMVIPVHCTGINAICDLKARLGEKCIVATSGDIYEY